MCGICGIAGPFAKEARIGDMLELLAHRGPDAFGIFEGQGCVLGHRRLAIVDLSDAGNQPMRTADGVLSMVANGEIYNHQALRDELAGLGYSFSSNSDCEVLLHGWRAWREALFAKINGMFAVAIFDSHTHELILARDRMGIKPLYFHQDGETLSFASEFKALLGRNRSWSLSHEGLAQFLAMQNTIGDATLIDGIRILEPGQWLRFKNGQLTRQTYWEPSFSNSCATFDEACRAFQATAKEAIDRHLMADVPASTYLSAGFDSGGVTALAAKAGRGPITSITGSFDAGGWYDEASGAVEIAKQAGVDHRILRIGYEDFTDKIDDLIWALDEPRMGMGAFPQFMTAANAANTHKFVLTGHGGDELFSGYPIFKVLAAASSAKQFLTLLLKMRLMEWPHMLYFWPHPLQSQQKRQGVPLLFSQSKQQTLLQPKLHQALRDHDPAAQLRAQTNAGASNYQRLFLTYLRVYLPGLLVVEDKISMAHSLESRTPLLDNEMVDLALSIPPDIKLYQGTLKAIPKEALRPFLPQSLYKLPKRGFPTPLAAWLRGPLRSWLCDRLDPSNSPLSQLIDPKHLQQETQGFLNSPTRHFRPLDEIDAHRMWMFIALDSWLRGLEQRLGVTVRV